MVFSIHKHEFIAVEDQTAQIRQTVLARVTSEFLSFCRSGRAVQRKLIRPCDLRVEVVSHATHALGEMLAVANDKAVVEHRQSLQCRHGEVSGRGQLRGISAVERVHEWVRQCPENESVNAAPTTRRAIDIEFCVIDNGRDVNAGRKNELLHRGSAHREVESATDLQHRVADGFGIEPASIHSPEETVVGVDGLAARVVFSIQFPVFSS